MKLKISCHPHKMLWLKKIISKGLVIGILFNNVGCSFANIKSLDERYETFEGNNITIDNVLEEDNVDVEIEGNTLVNYSHIKSCIAGNSPSYNREPFLKSGNTYTFVAKISDVVNGPFQGAVFRITFTDGSFMTPLDITYKEGDFKVVFATPSNKNIDYYYIGWIRSYVDGQSAKLDDLMILDGDWRDREIPEYFEGMKSVGQDDESGHKIEISSKNKNLFNPIFWDNVFTINNSPTSNGYNGYIIKAKPNTDYFVSCTQGNADFTSGSTYAYIITNNGQGHQWIVNQNSNIFGNTSFKITTGDDGYMILRVALYGVLSELKKLSIQIEEGCLPTSYAPYSLNKKEILLNEPLRSLSNGVKDRIVKRNGQWFVERNLGEVILDGTNTSWIHHENVSNNTTTHFQSNYIFAKTSADTSLDKTVNVICDNFANEIADNQWFSIAEESLCSNKSGRIGIRIKNSRLAEISSNGLNEWLKTNPIKIVYLLPDTIYEPLNIDATLNLYLDTTYISNNSTIPTNMKITIDRTINRAVEAIELAKENPTISNISLARMWINLMKESTTKDDLHNQVNNIVDVDDLSIEKKKVSGNIDVYVKSDNMLSMSLSTNSITFDNFTGIDDMELDNALNITVNSSLPYRLNSYLLSDLQNADGSVTMNRELLNIKMNNDTDYKVFTNLNEKVVLEDDCDTGNNNNHIIDFKLKGNNANKADVYKAIIKFEAEQK